MQEDDTLSCFWCAFVTSRKKWRLNLPPCVCVWGRINEGGNFNDWRKQSVQLLLVSGAPYRQLRVPVSRMGESKSKRECTNQSGLLRFRPAGWLACSLLGRTKDYLSLFLLTDFNRRHQS